MTINAPRILQIFEVGYCAQQGKTEPVRCRCEDGQFYYVKGQQTNRASLWAEWLCAHLARAFGLPVPEFALVQLDEALLPEMNPVQRALGCLPAFASRERQAAGWLEVSTVQKVPLQLRRDVLVFDWWVRNADRTMGNPNLLWGLPTQELVVIDHNLAFDPDFEQPNFLSHHIFAADWDAVVQDWVTRNDYAQRLALALPAAELALATAPPEWLWENSEQDVPARFDIDRAMTLLARCTNPDELWRTV